MYILTCGQCSLMAPNLKKESGVGCILIDPEQHKTLISYHLEFKCTNNTTEYEALVQGLKKGHRP
jgi:ribonuclease HI